MIIFSVKGGNLKLDGVRALDSVVKTQDAALGVLLLHRGAHGEDEGNAVSRPLV